MKTQRIQYPLQRKFVHAVEHDDHAEVTFRYRLHQDSEDLILEGGREKTIYFWDVDVDEVALGNVSYPADIARFLLDPDWYDCQVEEIKFHHNGETQGF